MIGEETIQLNSSIIDESNFTVNSLFRLSNYTFSHFVKNGTFRCLVRIGAESFMSNSSILYDDPSKCLFIFNKICLTHFKYSEEKINMLKLSFYRLFDNSTLGKDRKG